MVSTVMQQRKKLNNKRNSFEKLYDRHFTAVNRYLRYRVSDTWDADDLTAIVFMKAMDKFYQFEGSGSFKSWLFRIAHNTMVDYFKLKKDLPTEQVSAVKTGADGPEEKILEKEEVTLLKELVLELPDEYRDVISLRYVGELRFQQIGEVMGKSEGAVRTMHHRAIKMLRKMFGVKGQVPDER